jgi:hypothetical protein
MDYPGSFNRSFKDLHYFSAGREVAGKSGKDFG